MNLNINNDLKENGIVYLKNLLNKDGIIILHRNKTTKEKLPNFFKILDERVYGISKIIFGKILS